MVMEEGMFPLRLLDEKSIWVRLEWMNFGRKPVRLVLEMVKVLSFFM
jgi:hypothetical protein